MRLVKLYTAGGGFVVAGHVPPFLKDKEADVLFWGERVFKLNRTGAGEALADHEDALLYTEAFTIALVIIDEAKTA